MIGSSVCISIMTDLLLLLTPVIFLIIKIELKFNLKSFFIEFINVIIVIYVSTFVLFVIGMFCTEI